MQYQLGDYVHSRTGISKFIHQVEAYILGSKFYNARAEATGIVQHWYFTTESETMLSDIQRQLQT